MFTRSRQSQSGFPCTPQRQGMPPGQYQQQNYPYQHQGNFQSPQNYHGNFKQNAPQFIKAQQQQPGTPQQQHQAGGGPQQQHQPGTPQQQHQSPMMQQQQTPQMQQQPLQASPQVQKLKPILKPSAPLTPLVGGAPVTPTTGNAASAPIVQQSPAPNAAAETPDAEVQGDGMEVEGDGQKRWKRKLPGFKVNRKLKRLRLNQRLRKTLQPKNAIMVLNEMKTGVQFTFPETQASMPNSLFLVHAEIDGKVYVGQGLSKPLARQNAAENALKTLLLEKMTAASMKTPTDGESETSEVKSEPQILDETMESNNSMDTTADDQDEIPWSSLASFALYKLFLEWQNQGTVVPVPRPGVAPGKPKKEVKPHVPKELPPNALSIHPVMLLNQMRPGLVYLEVERVGNPPNTVFTLGVEVDGVSYRGTAKNKRDAKKTAAKEALQACYNLVYPEEKADEDVAMTATA